VAQSSFELRIAELETRVIERAGFDASAAKQHVIGHFAER
jgi:hypothetical protein